MDCWLSDRDYAHLLTSDDNWDGIFRVLRGEGSKWRETAIEYALSTPNCPSVIVVQHSESVGGGSQFPEQVQASVANRIHNKNCDRMVYHPGSDGVEKATYTMCRKEGPIGGNEIVVSILEARKVRFVEHARGLAISRVTWYSPSTIHVQLVPGSRLSRDTVLVTLEGLAQRLDGTAVIRRGDDPTGASFMVDDWVWELGQESCRVLYEASKSTSGAWCRENFERGQNLLFHCRLGKHPWPPPTDRREAPPHLLQERSVVEQPVFQPDEFEDGRGCNALPTDVGFGASISTGQHVASHGADVGVHAYDQNCQDTGVSCNEQGHQQPSSTTGWVDSSHDWNDARGQEGTCGFYQGTAAKEGWMGFGGQQQWNGFELNNQNAAVQQNEGVPWGQREGLQHESRAPPEQVHVMQTDVVWHQGDSGFPLPNAMSPQHPQRSHMEYAGEANLNLQSQTTQDVDLYRIDRKLVCEMMGNIIADLGAEFASNFFKHRLVKSSIQSMETDQSKLKGNELWQPSSHVGRFGEVPGFSTEVPSQPQTPMLSYPLQGHAPPMAPVIPYPNTMPGEQNMPTSSSRPLYHPGQGLPQTQLPISPSPGGVTAPPGCIGLEEIYDAVRPDGVNGAVPVFILVPTQDAGKFIQAHLDAKGIAARFFSKGKLTLATIQQHITVRRVMIITPGLLMNMASDDRNTEALFKYCNFVLIPKETDWEKSNVHMYERAQQRIVAGRCKVVHYSCVALWAAKPTAQRLSQQHPAQAVQQMAVPAPALPRVTPSMPPTVHATAQQMDPAFASPAESHQAPAPTYPPPTVEIVQVEQRNVDKTFGLKLAECMANSIRMVGQSLGAIEAFYGMETYVVGKGASQLESWLKEVEAKAVNQTSYTQDDVKHTLDFLRKANIMLDLYRDIGFHRAACFLMDFVKTHCTNPSLLRNVFDSFAQYDELKFGFAHNNPPELSDSGLPRVQALVRILQGVEKAGTAKVLILVKTKLAAYFVPEMVNSIQEMQSWTISWVAGGNRDPEKVLRMTAAAKQEKLKQFQNGVGCQALVATSFKIIPRNFCRFDAIIKFSADFPEEKELSSEMNAERVIDMSG